MAMRADNPPPILSDLSWTEARDLLALRPVGVMPIGAIEAHGPHLPLDTDVIIATGMARYAGAALRIRGLPAVVLPPVSYSVSFAGACFPGTTPVDAEALIAYLHAVLAQSSGQGYRALCLCNAHLEPAHIHAVSEAVSRARLVAGIPILFPDKRSDAWARHLGDEFQRGARHAGQYETSIVLAERPDAVRRTWLEELPPKWIDLPAALRAGARDFAEAGADMGYFGDPASATAERGRELLEILADLVCDHILESLSQE